MASTTSSIQVFIKITNNRLLRGLWCFLFLYVSDWTIVRCINIVGHIWIRWGSVLKQGHAEESKAEEKATFWGRGTWRLCDMNANADVWVLRFWGSVFCMFERGSLKNRVWTLVNGFPRCHGASTTELGWFWHYHIGLITSLKENSVFVGNFRSWQSLYRFHKPTQFREHSKTTTELHWEFPNRIFVEPQQKVALLTTIFCALDWLIWCVWWVPKWTESFRKHTNMTTTEFDWRDTNTFRYLSNLFKNRTGNINNPFFVYMMNYLVRLMDSSGAIQKQNCEESGRYKCVHMHQKFVTVHVHASRLCRLEFSNPGASDAPIQFCGL